MAKIKDIPEIGRPREKFLKKGSDALSKSDLLAVLLGSGIKGRNVQKLSQQIIKKFGKKFLNITIDDLQKISGIGQAKALQVVSAISLVKRYYADGKTHEIRITNSQNVAALTYDLKEKKRNILSVYISMQEMFYSKKKLLVLDSLIKHYYTQERFFILRQN